MMVFSSGAWMRIKDLIFPSQKKKQKKQQFYDTDFPKE